MKRNGTIILFAVLCLAAVVYGVPRWRLANERAQRSAEEAAALANSTPLVLDAATQTILSGADRVETFRLADFHEEENLNAGDRAILERSHVQRLGNYTILHIGNPQGKAFAATLSAALAQAAAQGSISACFDPGVAFRVWEGQAHTDICVCCYCSGVEIDTWDAHHHSVHQSITSLRYSRPAFLALSRQAFPQDKTLAVLK